ncbi:MAG: hypothetical protein NT027_10400 [Proteobacteria bacterium]|nr:hypothetical protein [Pseudomonadota bacterium]
MRKIPLWKFVFLASVFLTILAGSSAYSRAGGGDGYSSSSSSSSVSSFSGSTSKSFSADNATYDTILLTLVGIWIVGIGIRNLLKKWKLLPSAQTHLNRKRKKRHLPQSVGKSTDVRDKDDDEKLAS